MDNLYFLDSTDSVWINPNPTERLRNIAKTIPIKEYKWLPFFHYYIYLVRLDLDDAQILVEMLRSDDIKIMPVNKANYDRILENVPRGFWIETPYFTQYESLIPEYSSHMQVL